MVGEWRIRLGAVIVAVSSIVATGCTQRDAQDGTPSPTGRESYGSGGSVQRQCGVLGNSPTTMGRSSAVSTGVPIIGRFLAAQYLGDVWVLEGTTAKRWTDLAGGEGCGYLAARFVPGGKDIVTLKEKKGRLVIERWSAPRTVAEAVDVAAASDYTSSGYLPTLAATSAGLLLVSRSPRVSNCASPPCETTVSWTGEVRPWANLGARGREVDLPVKPARVGPSSTVDITIGPEGFDDRVVSLGVHPSTPSSSTYFVLRVPGGHSMRVEVSPDHRGTVVPLVGEEFFFASPSCGSLATEVRNAQSCVARGNSQGLTSVEFASRFVGASIGAATTDQFILSVIRARDPQIAIIHDSRLHFVPLTSDTGFADFDGVSPN